MEVPAGLESSPIGQKLLHGASMEPTNFGSWGKSQILSLTFFPSYYGRSGWCAKELNIKGMQPPHPTRTEHCWPLLLLGWWSIHAAKVQTDWARDEQPSDTDGAQYRRGEMVRFMRAAVHRLLDWRVHDANLMEDGLGGRWRRCNGSTTLQAHHVPSSFSVNGSEREQSLTCCRGKYKPSWTLPSFPSHELATLPKSYIAPSRGVNVPGFANYSIYTNLCRAKYCCMASVYVAVYLLCRCSLHWHWIDFWLWFGLLECQQRTLYSGWLCQ